jgi:hypothetical protein
LRFESYQKKIKSRDNPSTASVTSIKFFRYPALNCKELNLRPNETFEEKARKPVYCEKPPTSFDLIETLQKKFHEFLLRLNTRFKLDFRPNEAFKHKKL